MAELFQLIVLLVSELLHIFDICIFAVLLKLYLILFIFNLTVQAL